MQSNHLRITAKTLFLALAKDVWLAISSRSSRFLRKRFCKLSIQRIYQFGWIVKQWQHWRNVKCYQESMLKTFFLCCWWQGQISWSVWTWQKLSSLVLHLLEALEAYPRSKHLKGPLFGFALALPSNSKTGLKRVSCDKWSSLLSLVISDDGKKLYNIDARPFSRIQCLDKTNQKHEHHYLSQAMSSIRN